MKKQETFFVENIKFLRKRIKRTQEIAAIGLGMERGRLAAFECAQIKNPCLDDLINFSRYFQISIDLLIKEDLQEWPEYILQREIMSRK